MCEKCKKLDPKIWIASYVLISAILLYWYPPVQISHFEINNVTSNATLENQYRMTLAQILGGGAVAIGIYFAWKNFIIAQENLKAAQEGQITERFTRAVDQLGNDKVEIRLGGIYALERIANESDKDYWQIMEILTNFVRINSPVIDWDNKIQELKTPSSEHIKDKCKVRVDIQAVINVIGRRKYFFGAGEQKALYLRHSKLRMISLFDALDGAHLIGTDLKGAHLERAFLDFSDLIGATFNGAYLKKTEFTNSCLNMAQFEKTDLRWAIFKRCYIKKAYFSNADLSCANFSNADLTNTNFSNAVLANANFEGSILIEAKNLTVDQLSKVKTLYKAQLDERLEAELRAKGYSHLLDVKPEDEP